MVIQHVDITTPELFFALEDICRKLNDSGFKSLYNSDKKHSFEIYKYYLIEELVTQYIVKHCTKRSDDDTDVEYDITVYHLTDRQLGQFKKKKK